MAEIKKFVINDRRKFTAEGELRPDAPPSQSRPPRESSEAESSARVVETPGGPDATSDVPRPGAPAGASSSTQPRPEEDNNPDDQLPPAPTAEQSQQAARAYEATVERLETAIRATNPGMDPIPQMTFERVVQSLYMQALLQLGEGSESGQQPRVDILGARQTIDMLALIESKTKGNLSGPEQTLVDSALFEIRMAFLEITQALARQAQSRQPGMPGAPGVPPAGPSIVR